MAAHPGLYRELVCVWYEGEEHDKDGHHYQYFHLCGLIIMSHIIGETLTVDIQEIKLGP